MRTAAIVGTGLIGTSVALALNSRGVTTYLLDSDPQAVRTAAARGAGRPGRPHDPVDIAVLAVPPSHTARALAEQQALGLAEAYTDVASVKELPHTEAAELGCDTSRLVGGHPLAGRERSGPLAARADLFHDRPWVLTPTPRTSEDSLNRALELVALCGATPVLLEPAAHDRAVALVSHLPHLMASLTAARLLDGEEQAVRLAGRGAKDVTRIAAGDSALWADILAANAPAMSDLLTQLAADLGSAADALHQLKEQDPRLRDSALADLAELLERGRRGRARIATTHGAADPTSLSVTLTGQERQLERLLEDVQDTRVDLDAVELPDRSDQMAAQVRLLVGSESARPLTETLRSRGWAVSI